MSVGRICPCLPEDDDKLAQRARLPGKATHTSKEGLTRLQEKLSRLKLKCVKVYITFACFSRPTIF